jgi:hypothetical protein
MTVNIYVEHFHALLDKLINHLASSLRSLADLPLYDFLLFVSEQEEELLSCASTLIIHSSFQLHEKASERETR